MVAAPNLLHMSLELSSGSVPKRPAEPMEDIVMRGEHPAAHQEDRCSSDRAASASTLRSLSVTVITAAPGGEEGVQGRRLSKQL